MREVAASFGVSVGTVVNWVRQAHRKRLDRVNFTNRKPGRAWNRTPEELEQRILSARVNGTRVLIHSDSGSAIEF